MLRGDRPLDIRGPPLVAQGDTQSIHFKITVVRFDLVTLIKSRASERFVDARDIRFFA